MIRKLREFTESAIASRWFVPAQFIFTAVMMCAGLNALGAITLIMLSSLLFLLSDDTLAGVCPFMLGVMDITAFYDDYYVLLKYLWIFIPLLSSLFIHIIAYRGKFVAGRFLPSLLCVSAALLIGGAGTIPLDQYLSGVSLYYMLGLGAALVPLYLLFASRMSRERKYDKVERLAEMIYAMALLAVIIIALYYIHHWSELVEDFHTPFISYRNFCTTMMLLGLPMGCVLIKRSRWHLLGMALIYMMMLTGGSRSALIFGTVELILCLVYIYAKYPQHRRAFRRIALIAALPLGCVCAYLIYMIFVGSSGRFSEHFVRPNEARTKFYPRAIEDFLARPILGWGLGNTKNSDIWTGVSGSLVFYHNCVLQAMASLGLVGCAAYLYQFAERVRMLILRRRGDCPALAISFAGVLMMSMTNPGIYCPLPTALLLIIMFAVLEFDNSGENCTIKKVQS